MMDRNLFDYLPHRPPFAFVDEFEVSEDGKSVKGSRVFTDKEFFFPGHFPGNPVVPGVILVETMAQCGGAGLVKAACIGKDNDFFLASVKEAKFRRIVRPNDKLEMEIETIRVRTTMIVQKGVGKVNGEVAVQAEWSCAVVPHKA
jgi:3-hydroxyacyl-[acyl-carrier-protein] dehydratase